MTSNKNTQLFITEFIVLFHVSVCVTVVSSLR